MGSAIFLTLALFFTFILFLCYGSFLNVVGYRLVHGHSVIWPRSFCPNCKIQIRWYDLVPVVSWLILRSQCRNCKNKISFLYPAVEILTAVIFTFLIFIINPKFWLAYSIFFSALVIVIRTDLYKMLISRYTTLFLVPVAALLSYFNFLPITVFQSVTGALFGYLFLWSIAKIFFLIKNKQGMGEGDFELLAMIGAFTGIIGAWCSILLGSIFGSIIGLILIFTGKSLDYKVPFGPFLSLSAIVYVFFQTYLNSYFLAL